MRETANRTRSSCRRRSAREEEMKIDLETLKNEMIEAEKVAREAQPAREKAMEVVQEADKLGRCAVALRRQYIVAHYCQVLGTPLVLEEEMAAHVGVSSHSWTPFFEAFVNHYSQVTESRAQGDDGIVKWVKKVAEVAEKWPQLAPKLNGISQVELRRLLFSCTHILFKS